MSAAVATVCWPTQRRLQAAATVPVSIALACWSRTTTKQPSDVAAPLFAALALGASVFVLHMVVYRLEIHAEGLTERLLWGERRVGWSAIRQVELIAQAVDGERIVRWRASAPEAFHVVIHTAHGSLSVHRWMSGLGDVLQACEERGVLARTDERVSSVLTPTPMHDAIEKAHVGLERIHLVALAVPLSYLFGLVVSLSGNFHPTSSPFVDAALLAPLPWGAAYLVYVQISRSVPA